MTTTADVIATLETAIALLEEGYSTEEVCIYILIQGRVYLNA